MGVTNSNSSENDNLSKAAPAYTWINEGGATPKKVHVKYRNVKITMISAIGLKSTNSDKLFITQNSF
jgi:hypothetical protein